MGNEASDIKPERLTFEVPIAGEDQELSLARVARSVLRALGCDWVAITVESSTGIISDTVAADRRIEGSDGAVFTLNNGVVSLQGHPWNVPIIVNDLQRARLPQELALQLSVRKVRSFGAFPLIHGGRTYGVVECFFTSGYHRWRREEAQAFNELAGHVASLAGERGPTGSDPTQSGYSEELRGQYKRLARYGNIIILVTDDQFRITEAFGNTESIVGVSAAGMQRRSDIWDVIIDPRDRALLRRRIIRLRVERDELREEVRVIHQRTGEVRWMMLRALPRFSTQGVFQGWEGFGIDITDRRQAQEALLTQNQRLEALFEVSRALQGHTDPAAILLRAVRSIVRATGSHCGYACQFNQDTRELEVSAAVGFTESYFEAMTPVLSGPSMLRTAVDAKVGFKVEDMQSDPRAVSSLARREGLKSAIVMPLVSESEVYGAIVIFKREAGAYTDLDYELISAAASQMALAVRQAERFDSERRNGEALAALYRLSREVAKYRSAHEIAESAFPILQHEFALKRGWFGIINEQGTHLVGQRGFGPGVRRRLQEIQIELNLRHDVIDQAVATKRPVLWTRGEPLECSGLNRIVDKLHLETFIAVPLVSIGQVAGVLVLEPMMPGTFFAQGRVQLLVSMANEIATVVTARRFESKMADSLKMRMAGLLASGVAHNFNNLLQAVLGQVALIEMQLPRDSGILEATKTITDAARRGASLVAQLLSFSAQSPASRQVVALDLIVENSQELYDSLLGKRIKLAISAEADRAQVSCDVTQLQQVITNLLVNAKEAVSRREDPRVSLSTTTVRLRSGEVDPELAPGSYVRLDVTDNGVGLTPEAVGRCFEPFFTTKSVDPATGVGISGAGLGLASAYSIIKQHAGLLTVHSIEGEGATFSIYLPVVVEDETQGQKKTAQEDDRRVEASQVFMLGWEAGEKPFVSSIFESFGYKPRSAYDVRQLRELLSQGPTPSAMLILDLDTCSASVLKECQQLLHELPELSIVGAVSGRSARCDGVFPPARFELLEKPLGVWGVERILKRFAQSASPL